MSTMSWAARLVLDIFHVVTLGIASFVTADTSGSLAWWSLLTPGACSFDLSTDHCPKSSRSSRCGTFLVDSDEQESNGSHWHICLHILLCRHI